MRTLTALTLGALLSACGAALGGAPVLPQDREWRPAAEASRGAPSWVEAEPVYVPGDERLTTVRRGGVTGTYPGAQVVLPSDPEWRVPADADAPPATPTEVASR